jgi:hypothetical protein
MGSYEQPFAGGAEQGLTSLSRACFVSWQPLGSPRARQESGSDRASARQHTEREELHADDCQGAGHEKKVSHAGRSHDDLDTAEIRDLRWPNTIGAASATPTAASSGPIHKAPGSAGGYLLCLSRQAVEVALGYSGPHPFD